MQGHALIDALPLWGFFLVVLLLVLLSVEGGWLKTMWQPVGFMIFPGRFEDDKWRPVLDAMSAIASSLDSSQHLTS